METNKEKVLRIEEELNASQCSPERNKNRIHIYKKSMDEELLGLTDSLRDSRTFYQEICEDIRKIKTPNFIKPVTEAEKTKEEDADIDAPKFYFYAWIDKNSWHNIKRNKKGIRKETALKLVIALQLTQEQAGELLKKISFVLNDADYRDQIVIALLNARCFDPNQASSVLEWYSKYGIHKFTNIYDL